MAARFDDLGRVQVLDRPIYCRKVKAALCPGNWVCFNSDDECFHSEYALQSSSQKLSVGLIMATDESRVKINLFVHVTDLLNAQLRLRQFTTPRYRWIPQILRTPTCKWINPNDVISIAWVFQLQDIDAHQHEGHQGMMNLFILHHNDEGMYTHIYSCHPFCSKYPQFALCGADCYQERVWYGLQVLRSEIGRHLGRFSEKQGSFNKVSSQVVVGREAWAYLLAHVGQSIRTPIGRNAMVSKRVLEPGLLLKSQQSVFYSTFVRFETEEELRVLSTILGELVTVEVRKRRPKYGVVESFHLNDIANVVAGSEEREEPFRIRTSQQGVDFVHDGTNRVRIRLRYQRYQRSRDSLAGCPSTILSRAIQRKRLLVPDDDEDSSSDDDGDDEDEGERAIVVIGRQFEVGQRVYAVQAIEGTKVSAFVVWPLQQNAIVEFEIDNVATLIQSRIDEDE